MSVAACGGGKRGSDDDERKQGGDEKKKKKKIGLAQLLGFVPSSKDKDKKEDNDEKTILKRQITVVHRPTARAEAAPPPLEKRISKSFDDLKGMVKEDDGRELREEGDPFNKKRILSLHVMSSLYKMSRAVSVPVHVHDRPNPNPNKADQLDIVEKAEKKTKKKNKKKMMIEIKDGE